MEHTIARRVARDANWLEATAAVLLDSQCDTEPHHDRLIENWAALRDLALGSNGRLTDSPARKAG
jgi:hypothetical protein